MNNQETTPIHDEDVSPTSILNVGVAVHQSLIERLKPDDSGWYRLSDSEKVVIRLQLSPDAWRAFGKVFLRYPHEPEWRLKHGKMPDGSALSAWSECRASDSEMLSEGPGVFMHPNSCMLTIEIKDFDTIETTMREDRGDG